MSQDFGKATYVAGRHRKNPVLIYTSRTDRSKVYEFMIAAKFKVAGLVSWKCVSCSRIKNGYRNLGAELKRKVPLILVDNDVIKEDPEKPLNAEHFCNGKEAVEAVLTRAKMEFVHRHGNDDISDRQIRETIQDFAREAVTTTPIPLNNKEKKHVQRTLDANCLPLLHGVKKRRRCKQMKGVIGSFKQEQHETGLVAVKKEVVEEIETPVQRARRQSRSQVISQHQSPVMVRPLPYYYRVASSSSSSSSQNQLPQQQNHHEMPEEYYEEVVQGTEHRNARLQDFDHEELIPADQQNVAYDIELR